VFAGYAWFLHDSAWLLAVLGAVGGSMMVSYTRARAEGLGVELAGGMMQRAERIVLVATGTLIAAWYGSGADTQSLVEPIVGVTMLSCAVGSTATAINRWLIAYRELVRRQGAGVSEPLPPPAAAPAPSAPRVHLSARVPKVASLEHN
jgi:CDP-diacylglycerol--glycerol-3-phosphate 3-phosphatidyltransferase